MSIISDDVYERVRARGVEVFFVPRAATKWWNAQRRDDGEIALLGGWYWSLGGDEAGPFRSQSAAWRDVYYRRVLRHRPPMIDAEEVSIAEKEAQNAEQAERTQRRRRRRRVHESGKVVTMLPARVAA